MEKKHTNKQKVENLYYDGGPFGMYPMPFVRPSIGAAVDYSLAMGDQQAKFEKAKSSKVTANNFGSFQTAAGKGFAEGGLLANPDGLMFTEDEVANIVRANTNKGRKKRMEEAKESKKSYRGVLPESDGTLFAIGGDLQTHGSDWSTKAMHINAGGQHEENPNDGIQIGTDSEGVPNLVEEGEVIFDDYVFSNRIELDEKAKEALHFPKKIELTYAEAAKKLEKEIAERPNDAISVAGFKAQMEQLEEQQERQKQEMEAERAKEAFEALSPEEQTALMQQKAQQDAMEEQAAQEQAMAEAQATQGQPSPEEMAAMEQQAAMAQQQMSPEEAAMIGQQMAAQQSVPEAAPVEQPVMAAEGGEINRFDDGGKLKQAILKIAGVHTLPEFRAWAKKNKIKIGDADSDAYWDAWDPEKTPYEELIKQEAFRGALGKSDPALAHALSKSYDFGVASPEGQNATITDIDNGNWDNQEDKWLNAWSKSEDSMWKDLQEKLGKDWETKLKDLKRSEIEALLKETPSYKNTTEWLKKNPENMRQYLNTVLKESTSDAAKNHALQFINEDGTWKDASSIPTYAQIFGENGKGVRETYPGTYWHSVAEASPINETINWVQDDKGNWVPIETEVPEDWKLANNYSWYDKANNTNRAYNYYTRPEVAAAGKDTETEEDGTRAIGEDGEKTAEGEIQLKPRYKKETNFGLFGPAVGLGLQLMGVGKPDTSAIDAAIASANSAPHLAEYKPLGNYLTYNPLDIWYEQNALNAQSRATDRGIMNAGANQGSTMAGLIANGYNSQLASGDLYRKGLEYNNTLKQQVEAFNRGTDQYNADAFTRNSQFNASALNQNKNFGAQLAMQGATQKMDADAGWYNSLYGNIGGIFNNLKQWEKYKRDHNTLADMWANGLAGTVTDKTPVASKYVTAVKSSDGGKVKRKKGKKRGMFI